MNENRVGKPPPSRLKALLGSRFGAFSEQILLGPGPGLDAAVLDLKDGRVMAIAEDPIFPAPGLPLDLMGWFTVHIGASDVAVTGIAPQFMTYSLLLPSSSTEDDVKTIVTSISDAASDLGISIAGGHTGWYDAVTVPIVGGVTVWGFADRSAWVSPGGSQDGDVILMTKGPAIEAVALLSVVHRGRLGSRISNEALQQALARVRQISVVKDALTAFAEGGIHAMHDATEGGVLGGVHEMAAAAGIPAHVNPDGVNIPPDIVAVADALGFDPWYAISEGTLLASVLPESAARIRNAWSKAGIDSYELGFFNKSPNHSTVCKNGKTTQLTEPGVDPFWELFFSPGNNDG
ncbi:MAG: AIR synthase family protein [Desulfobacterales bacterium]|nr:AIR synthase family protein [Desulfobacterales bacterium]